MRYQLFLFKRVVRHRHLFRKYFSSNERRLDQQPAVRLRFAPSPTGFLHLGGLRTALFNHLLARKLNGKWILRIEDTDKSRFVPGASESIAKTLKWANLEYDEGPDRPGECGPYIQSLRQTIYQSHLDRLLQSGQAYRCFCSPERLAKMRQKFKESGSNLTYDRKCLQLSGTEVECLSQDTKPVIRLKNPDVPVTFDDLVYGKLTFHNNTQDDAILVKADGMPTYHFANVVDDHEMGISHVLRGEEWLSSTPKHLILYSALGFNPPRFAHIPLLVNADGSKLSKRSGDVRVEDYMAQGYEPQALLNFVALMGMTHVRNTMGGNPEGDKASDVMTMAQMVSAFSIEAIGKHRSTMSQPKLNYLNQQHIARSLDSSDPDQVGLLIERAKDLLHINSIPTSGHSDTYVYQVLQAMKDRLHVFSDLKYLAAYFFHLPDLTTPEAMELKQTIPSELYSKILKFAYEEISLLPDEETNFTQEMLSERLKAAHKLNPEMKANRVMGALRHAITGRKVGAGMVKTIEILGKHRTLKRISAAMNFDSSRK